MAPLGDGFPSQDDGRSSHVQLTVTALESGLMAALVGLVLLFTMTNAAAIVPALSFVSGQ